MTSADPLGLAVTDKADLNLYGYVRGRPLNAIDPNGMEEVNAVAQAAEPELMAETYKQSDGEAGGAVGRATLERQVASEFIGGKRAGDIEFATEGIKGMRRPAPSQQSMSAKREMRAAAGLAGIVEQLTWSGVCGPAVDDADTAAAYEFGQASAVVASLAVAAESALLRGTVGSGPTRWAIEGAVGRRSAIEGVTASAVEGAAKSGAKAGGGGSRIGRWKNGVPSVQVARVGDVWVKQVNPNANAFMRWWGRQTIQAQYRGLERLGDMATPHARRGDRLFTRDVGPVLGDGFRLLSPTSRDASLKGSVRMGTFWNDIQPRNMGANGLVFDSAIDSFYQSDCCWPGFGRFGGSSL